MLHLNHFHLEGRSLLSSTDPALNQTEFLSYSRPSKQDAAVTSAKCLDHIEE